MSIDVRFTKNIQCMIDRGARYKVYVNSSPSGATRHTPFPRGDTDERGDFSARARSGTRGGVRVAFGTQSTMEHRSSNGSARGKSRAKVLVDPPAAPICNRCRLCSSRGTRSRSQLWRYANATFVDTLLMLQCRYSSCTVIFKLNCNRLQCITITVCYFTVIICDDYSDRSVIERCNTYETAVMQIENINAL